MRFFIWGNIKTMNQIIQEQLDFLATAYLQELGFKVSNKYGGFQQYLNFQYFRIRDKPRKVSFSKKLNFCSKYIRELEIMKQKFEGGIGHVYKHQSRKILKGGASFDHMYYDFGIHHLHLSFDIDQKTKKLFKGTEHLLAVYVNEDEAFFIDVIGHNEWHLQSRLALIHNERPDLIEHRVVDYLKGEILTDEEILVLRENGYSYLLDINNTCYQPESILVSGNFSLITLKKYQSIATTILYQLAKLHSEVFKKINDSNLDQYFYKLIEFDFDEEKYVVISLSNGMDTKNYKILL